jgi:DNA-binding NarL/FixJ family response regulator
VYLCVCIFHACWIASAEIHIANLRLLLADDHNVVRVGLRCLLEGQPGWEVVAEASDGREAVAKALETRPDVALLDIGMPVLNGLEAAHQIVQGLPRTKILMLTVHDSEAMIHKVLAVGARGYLFKTDVARDLVAAITAVHADDTFFTAKVADIILASFKTNCANVAYGSPYGRLTPRQSQVVQLLADGLSSKEVAALLNISIKTAETHRANIMRRLNCHSVAEIVRYALHNRIIEA